MAGEISRLLGVATARVSVKAKTAQGFAPGRQGIAAQAVVLLTRARRGRGQGAGGRGR
jgi:2C-methyl-D-erythritol 2,4-cyclodiphosphate synthase